MGPSPARRARWSAQISPYSAHVVMRTPESYTTCQTSVSPASIGKGSAARADVVRASRYADLRHLAKIEDVVDLAIGQHVLALHEIADQHAFLHGLFADLRRARVADVRHQRGRERRRALYPIRA